MNKSQKTLLISFLPSMLTLFFIINIVIPAIGNMNDLNQKLNSEKNWQNSTKEEISLVKENNSLLKNVEKMRDELSDFDIRIPQTRELAILLYDLEKFAKPLNVRVLALNAKSEKIVELDESALNQTQKNKKKSIKKKKKSKKLESAILYSIPVEIKVLGHYNDIVKFVNTLEKYQRMVAIDTLTLERYKEDESNSKPRVETTIQGFVYKFEIKSREELASQEDSDESGN